MNSALSFAVRGQANSRQSPVPSTVNDPLSSILGKDTDILGIIARHYSYARANFSTWRRDVAKFYDAYAADPITEADKQALKADKRINAVFSYVTTTINAVIGQDQGDRKEVRFEAVNNELEARAAAEWFTNLVRYVFQKSDGHRIDSAVLLDLLVSGYGWSGVYIDNTKWPFQVRVEHVDPWEMLPDPDAKDDNLADAKWIIREHAMAVEQAKLLWPDVHWEGYVEDAITPASSPIPKRVSADGYYDETSSDENSLSIALGSDSVKILEYQYIVYEPYMVTVNDAGAVDIISEADFKRMMKAEAAAVDPETGQQIGGRMSGTPFMKKKVRRAWVAQGVEHNKLLDDAELPVDEFTYKCATGLRHKAVRTGKSYRFGLMKLMYDPQYWSARALSLIIEILGRMSKQGIFYEESAIEDLDDFEQRYSQPGSAIGLKDGGLQRIQERGVGNWPNSLDQMFKLAQTAVADVSGISEYMKGTSTSERSNVLVSNLQQQNIATLNPLLDQMNAYRMSSGVLIAKVSLGTMTDQYVDKILGEAGQVTGVTVEDDGQGNLTPIASAGSIMRTMDVQDYLVQVDTGAASPTARQNFVRSFVDTDLLGKIMQWDPDAARELVPMFVRNLQLPPEMTEKMARKIEDALKAPDIEKLFQQIQQLPPDQLEQLEQGVQQLLQQQGGEQPAEEQSEGEPTEQQQGG